MPASENLHNCGHPSSKARSCVTDCGGAVAMAGTARRQRLAKPPLVRWVGSTVLSRRRGLGQFEAALCDGGSGGDGLRFAGDLHGREGEFDAVLVECLLDHRIGFAGDHELFAGTVIIFARIVTA